MHYTSFSELVSGSGFGSGFRVNSYGLRVNGYGLRVEVVSVRVICPYMGKMHGHMTI